MIGVLLVVLIAYSRAQTGNSPPRNGLHTTPSVHQHQQGINWSNFDDIVEIDKDSEWQEYHDKVLFKDKQQPTKNTKAGKRKPIIIVDESFKSNAKTYKGLQDAKRKWLLQKNDPERFKRKKKEYYDRRREREAIQKSLLNLSNSNEESQIYQKQQKREKEMKKKDRLKKLTGYSNYRSTKLNKLRTLVDNEEATPKQIEELEKMREKDKIRHRQHRAKKKLEGVQAANNNNKRV